MASLLLPLFLTISSAFIFALMNVLDKFVISRKVKNPLSFSVIAGMVNFLFGLILASFLQWSGLRVIDLFLPAIVGIMTGLNFFLYYAILRTEDISSVIGFIYFYPVIVAILSFFFLGEILPVVSYAGVILILTGVFLLSLENLKIKLKTAAVLIIPLILFIALNEFFIKIATVTIPELNGISITLLFIGLTTMTGLVIPSIRTGFSKEFRNISWAILNESLTFLGLLTMYFALALLPATIFSAIAATQPLFVLILEFLFYKLGINISWNIHFRKKIIPILLIVVGVVVVYLPEIMMPGL